MERKSNVTTTILAMENGLLPIILRLIGINTEYRIKPAPKYRPFKDAKECWQEMLKHQPFGWTRDKDYDIYDMVTRVTDSGILFSGSYFNEIATYDFSYDRVTFADGTPFGIKEEL